jgi:hypothetical protein
LFDAWVTFNPVCEPDDPQEDPEILYAVETGTPVGASIIRTGEVAIGWDDVEVLAFPNLDSIIESDALYAESAQMNVVRTVSEPCEFEPDSFTESARQHGISLRFVDEASGPWVHWFESDALRVFMCRLFSELVGTMPPYAVVFAHQNVEVDAIERLLGRPATT